jgi:DNA ligase (NAD+)
LLDRYGNEGSVLRAVERARDDSPGEAYLLLADDSDIGPVAADSLVEFAIEEHTGKIVRELLQQVQTKPIEKPARSSPIAGKTIVFTGTLEKMTRSEAKALAERLGAKTSESVSARTDLLVAGPGAGSKLADAKKNQVKVITEEEWLALVSRDQLRPN